MSVFVGFIKHKQHSPTHRYVDINNSYKYGSDSIFGNNDSSIINNINTQLYYNYNISNENDRVSAGNVGMKRLQTNVQRWIYQDICNWLKDELLNENTDENAMKNRKEKAKYHQNGNNKKNKEKDAKVDDMKNTGVNNIESVHLANDIINKISSIFEMNYIAGHVLLVVEQELLELMVIIKKKNYEKVLKLTRNCKRNFSVLFIESKYGHEYICLAYSCDYYYNLFLMECKNVHYNSIKQQYSSIRFINATSSTFIFGLCRYLRLILDYLLYLYL